jgi:hypothetical protein
LILAAPIYGVSYIFRWTMLTYIVFTKKALGKRVDHTHHFYDPSISSTMKPLEPKSTFRIDYADGSWAKGDVVLVSPPNLSTFTETRIPSTWGIFL